ncbi:MAG: Na/Pi cotransporter family protein [Ruminococcaceae bacterium]|nr:Na/Pi cotransporter family protein [Oscillospiraceae bacterium]
MSPIVAAVAANTEKFDWDSFVSASSLDTEQWLKVAIGLIGGLVFFLFGMNVMSGSLEKMAGGKLESSLKKMTANPLVSIFLGAAITIAVQSSSATTVMLVGLVNSGLMTMSQTLFVIYGANIGTTFTSWILSLSGIQSGNLGILMLKPANFAPVLALVGMAFIMLSKNDRKKSLATIFVGFSVLIYGMEWMGDAVEPLENVREFATLLSQFQNPLVGLLIGTLFTAVIQSSAATIALVQNFAAAGMVTNGMALPLVMGANIGTCITSILSCIGTNRNAKRVAVLHLTMNVIGTVVWMAALILLQSFVTIPWLTEKGYASRFTVAVSHSIFNVLTAALLLPMNKLMEKIAYWIIPDKAGEKQRVGLFLDERLLLSPSVAVTESNVATGKMCKLANENVRLAMGVFEKFDEQTAVLIEQNEETLDMDEDKLGTFLVKLSAQPLSQNNSHVVSKMLHAIGDFERLGDHALNLLKAAREMRDKNIVFTEQARGELKVLTSAIQEIMDLTERAYTENDLLLAAQVEPLEQVIDGLIARIRANHIARLQSGVCTIEMGFVLSDILTNYERISDHCSNVAVALIEVEHDSFDTHQYLNGVKFGNEEFNSHYDAYRAKFSL